MKFSEIVMPLGVVVFGLMLFAIMDPKGGKQFNEPPPLVVEAVDDQSSYDKATCECSCGSMPKKSNSVVPQNTDGK